MEPTDYGIVPKRSPHGIDNAVGTVFLSNTKITVFDEFQYFTSVTRVNTRSRNQGSGGFRDCTKLMAITLPPNCTSLGYGCFYGCTVLSRITNVEQLVDFGTYQYSGGEFYQCYALTTLLLPNIVGGISQATDSCTALKTVLYGKGLTNLGAINFWRGVYADYVMVMPTTPPSFGSYNTNANAFYVPDESVAAYKAASGWTAVASKIHGYSELPADKKAIWDLYDV